MPPRGNSPFRLTVEGLNDKHALIILEHFLGKLVPAADPCWAHAEQATATAQALGANLPQKDTMKGVIHAWLAWQAEPGLPFGTALTAGVLGRGTRIRRLVQEAVLG